MTCIVGLVSKDGVYIGGDSAGVYDTVVERRTDVKVFRRADFVIGFTSSFRMGQLLRFKLNAPPQHADTDTYEYMVTDFIDAVRDCLKDGGYARKSEEAETGGTFLVGYKGRLFEVDEDYQVAEHIAGYTAVGCGARFALGALYALKHITTMGAREMVKVALEAAAEMSTGVRAPFSIEKV